MHFFARAGVYAHTRMALFYKKCAEAGDRHFLALGECFRDRVEHRINDILDRKSVV